MNEIKFGGISRSCVLWKDDIKKLKELGFLHVELRVDNVDNDSLIYNEKFQNEICQLLKRFNMTVTIHAFEDVMFGESIKKINDVIMQILVAQVKLAYNLGAKQIVFHLGKYPNKNHGCNKKQRIENAKKLLKDLIGNTEDIPVKILIENLKYCDENKGCSFLGDDIDEIFDVKNSVKSDKIGVVLDIGHMMLHKKTYDQILNKAELCINEVDEIHLHFNNFEKDQHLGVTEEFVCNNIDLIRCIRNILNKASLCVLEMDLIEAKNTKDFFKNMNKEYSFHRKGVKNEQEVIDTANYL